MGTLAGFSLDLALLFKLPPPDPSPLQKILPGRVGGTGLCSLLVVGVGTYHLLCLEYAPRSASFPSEGACQMSYHCKGTWGLSKSFPT